MLNHPISLRRRATGMSLILAGTLSVAGMAATPWEPDDTTVSFIETISAHATRGQVAPLLLHYGWVALAAGIAGLFTRLRRRGAVLGHVAGGIAFVGAVNLSGLLLVDWFAIALGQSDLPTETAASIYDSTASPLFITAWAIPGLAGYVLGLPAFLLALWRSGFLPWWPAAVTFTSLAVGEILPTNPIAAVASVTPYAVALAYTGLRVLNSHEIDGAPRDPSSTTTGASSENAAATA